MLRVTRFPEERNIRPLEDGGQPRPTFHRLSKLCRHNRRNARREGCPSLPRSANAHLIPFYKSYGHRSDKIKGKNVGHVSEAAQSVAGHRFRKETACAASKQNHRKNTGFRRKDVYKISFRGKRYGHAALKRCSFALKKPL